MILWIHHVTNLPREPEPEKTHPLSIVYSTQGKKEVGLSRMANETDDGAQDQQPGSFEKKDLKFDEPNMTDEPDWGWQYRLETSKY